MRRYDHTRIIAFTKNLNRLLALLEERTKIDKNLKEKIASLSKRMGEAPSAFHQIKKELAAIADEIQETI